MMDFFFPSRGLEYRVAHGSQRTVFKTSWDYRKMKSQARFSYRVLGSDFVKTLKSRSRILKQGSRRVSDLTIRHPFKCFPVP